MILFIDLFLCILNENIQFKKTKSQPLLPYQALIVSNKFKSSCIKLINHFNVKWDQGDPIKISSVYQKDKKRSQRIFESFINALNNIRDKLLFSKHIQYPILSLSVDIMIESDNNNNDFKCVCEYNVDQSNKDIDISKQEVSFSPSSPSIPSSSSNNNNDVNSLLSNIKNENKSQMFDNLNIDITLPFLNQNNNNNNNNNMEHSNLISILTIISIIII